LPGNWLTCQLASYFMSQIHYSFFEDQNNQVNPHQGGSLPNTPLGNDALFLQHMAFGQQNMQGQNQDGQERTLIFDQQPSQVQGFSAKGGSASGGHPQEQEFDSRTGEQSTNRPDSRNTRLVLLKATLEDIQMQVVKALNLVKEELSTPSMVSISEISQAQMVTKKEINIEQQPLQYYHQQPPQSTQSQPTYETTEQYGQTKIIEGIFDGQHMIGPDGKQYNIPANYASKSKLVEGDILKLTMSQQGSFMFKQIGPIERLRLVGVLGQDSLTRDHYAHIGEHKWRILTASVTYYKGMPGDEIIILIPKDGVSKWAAVENIVKRTNY